MQVGNQAAPAAKKQEYYTVSLAKLAIVGLIILTVVLVFFLALAPTFDERYVVGLLARHEPTLASAEFVWSDIVYGNQTFEEFGAYDYFDDMKLQYFNETVTMPGWRGAEVRSDESGVIDGHMMVISSSARPVAMDNSSTLWKCADNTTLEIGIAETTRYLYIGATGNRLTRAALDSEDTDESGASWMDMIQNLTTSFSDAVIEGAQATENLTDPIARNLTSAEAGLWKIQVGLDNAKKSLMLSEIWYFRPDQRSEFDAVQAGLREIVADCSIASK